MSGAGSDTRAEMAAVHSSITPEELGRLLTASHLDVGALRGDEAEPRISVIYRNRKLEVQLTPRVRGQNLFRQVVVAGPGGMPRLGVLDSDGGASTEYIRRRLVGIIENPMGDAGAHLVAGATKH